MSAQTTDCYDSNIDEELESLIRLRYVCRECGHVLDKTLTENILKNIQNIQCDGCGHPLKGYKTDRLFLERVIERCVTCGGRNLYIRKDFKQKTGVFIVGIATVAATALFIFNKNMLWPILVMVISAIIDAILYRMLPDLSACYQCKAEYRGMKCNPDHKPYSHYTAERYRAQAQEDVR